MKVYTKIYFQHFGIEYYPDGSHDYTPCEIPSCPRLAVDIHHIKRRGMGGTKKQYAIEELMGLCRECHIEFGDKEQYMEFLTQVHYEYLKKIDKKNETYYENH